MNCQAAHRGGAEIERLAGLHDVRERLDRLLDRRVRIEAMDDVEVDVIRAEALQGTVDPLHDVLAREALLVRLLAHRVEDLRRDHDLVALCHLLQRAAGDLLAAAEGVHVGGVEEVDALLQRLADEGAARLLVEDPFTPGRIAVGHAAEAEARDGEAGGAEANVVHGECFQVGLRMAARRGLALKARTRAGPMRTRAAIMAQASSMAKARLAFSMRGWKIACAAGSS